MSDTHTTIHPAAASCTGSAADTQASAVTAETEHASGVAPAAPSTNGKIQLPSAIANAGLARDDSAGGEQSSGRGSGGGSDGGGGGGGKEPGGDGAPAARQPREAIVYFPGLRRDGVESIEAVAHRVALAMDNNDPGASYSAATGETAVFAEHRARKATVVRKYKDGREAGVLDVYELDYRGPLVDGFGKRSALYQGWQVFATMVGNTRNFIAAVKRPGQSIPQKLQVLYGGLLLSTMLLYIAFLLLTAAVTANQGIVRLVGADSVRVEKPAAPAAAPAPVRAPRPETSARDAGGKRTRGGDWLTGVNGDIDRFFAPATSGIRFGVEVVWAMLLPIGLALGAAARAVGDWAAGMWHAANLHAAALQATVASITVVGLGFRFNLKEALARTSGTTACVGGYLAYGKGRPEIVGMAARLLEHLRADAKVEYTRIHVVGYSFGSVVAIDCVYQDSEMSAAFDDVVTLTTIGCPADFIRTYWRDYFVSRHGTRRGVAWLNVYSQGDVLASNFMDGGTCGIGASKDFDFTRDKARANGISLCPKAAARLYGENHEHVQTVAKPGATSKATPAEAGNAESGAEAEGKAAQDQEIHVIPNEHVIFGHRAPSGAWGWAWFILAGNGFRAHRCYWADGISNAKTCWEPLVARVCQPSAVPHPPAGHVRLHSRTQEQAAAG